MEQLVKMDIISQIRIERLENKIKEILSQEQCEEIFSYALADISTEEFEQCTEKHGYAELMKQLELLNR